MDADLIKSIIPLITFVLGIFSAPIVEHLKSKYQDEKLINGMKEEFRDEICEIKIRIEKMASSLRTLVEIKENTFEGNGALKYIPRETLMIFLEKALFSNYAKISSKERNTLKSITAQINAINGFSKAIMELDLSDETIDEIIKIQKNFIYTACCLRYSMLYYLNPEGRMYYREITDQKMIENQLSEVGVSIGYKDLIISKSTTFNK